MKKYKFISFAIIVALFMSSCSQMTFNKINTTVYETRQQDINKGAIPYNPVIADLKVDLDKKITGSSIRQVNTFNEFELENTKQASLYNAVTNSGADVVVDPIFKINITNNNGKDDKISIQSEVSGFYGKYTSIHKADANELVNASYGGAIAYLNDNGNSTQKQIVAPIIPDPDPAATAAEAAKKKKKRRRIIGWTIGSTLIFSLAIGLGLTLGVGSGY